VLTAGDFDGDERADLAVRTYQGDEGHRRRLSRGRRKGLVAAAPTVTFSTSEFLAG